MLYSNIIEPYIRHTEQHPDQTAARIGGQVYSYAQLAQRIAPIMNELDAMSIDKVGVIMKPDLTSYAAVLACLFAGVVSVPLSPEFTEDQIHTIQESLKLPYVLTVERMHYYFRMTFEDALSRIDNGLYDIEDPRIVSIQCNMGANNELTCRNIYAKDLLRSKPFSLSPVFQKLTPDFPEICSIR